MTEHDPTLLDEPQGYPVSEEDSSLLNTHVPSTQFQTPSGYRQFPLSTPPGHFSTPPAHFSTPPGHFSTPSGHFSTPHQYTSQFTPPQQYAVHAQAVLSTRVIFESILPYHATLGT